MIKIIRDAQNKVIAYGQDDDNYSPSIPSGATVSIIDESELAALLAPSPAEIVAKNKEAIQAQIDNIEKATLAPRFVREWFLVAAVKEAVAIGVTEPQLYQANASYKKAKDINTQIVALRAQL